MKVQIFTKIQSKVSTTESKFDLVVGASDTVAQVQERVLSIQPNSFPSQKMLFNGRELPGNTRLSDSGVKEGSELHFIISPTAADFCQQLAEFLKPRNLAPQELSLLYSHKYGVSISEALESLDFKGDFQQFLHEQKGFVFQNGQIQASVQQPTDTTAPEPSTLQVVVKLCVASSNDTEERSVELTVAKSSTILTLKEQIKAAELVPFQDCEILLDGEILNDDQTLKDCNVTNSSGLVMSAVASLDGLALQLAAILRGLPRAMSSATELMSLYCYRHGCTLLQALRAAGWKGGVRQFLEESEQFSVTATGCVTLRGPPGLLEVIPENPAESVDALVNAVLSSTFLNVDKVVTNFVHNAPEVVLYVRGLPPKGSACSWRLALSRAMANTLGDADELTDVQVTASHLQVRGHFGTTVLLRFEPSAL